MADNLGDLNLQIGGDIGPLEDAFNSIPAVAQQAAANIDVALASIGDEGSAAAAGLQGLSDTLATMWSGDWAATAKEFDAALAEGGEAASQAIPALDQFTDAQGRLRDAQGRFVEGSHESTHATHQAAEGAHEAGSAFESLGETLMHALEKLGLMVTAWEALKLTMEAVAAEQSFLVSMEALTGSAEKATDALEHIDAMALQLPVAFESLLQATQRLQAFGIEAERIPEVLRAAADAAAASGQAFDTVAAGLERVQVTGTVMARSLMQMGITWKQVADDMGVSVAQAQAAFKKGVQSADEDVAILIDTIEKNYGGLSEKLAQTVGGQFQLLKNQLTELADSLGQALAPIAIDLIKTFELLVPVLEGDIAIINAVIGGFIGLGNTIGVLFGLFDELRTKEQQAADSAYGLVMQQEHAKIMADELAQADRAMTAALTEMGAELVRGTATTGEWDAKLRNLSNVAWNVQDAFVHSKDGFVVFNEATMNAIKEVPGLIDQFALLAKAASEIAKNAPDAAEKIAAIGKQAAAIAVQALAAKDAAQSWNTELDAQYSKVNAASAKLAEYNKQFQTTGEGYGLVVKANKEFGAALDALEGKSEKHKTNMAAINELVREGEKNTLAYNKALDTLSNIFGDMDSKKGLIASLDKMPQDMQDFQNQVLLANTQLSPMEKYIDNIQQLIDKALKDFYAMSPAQKQIVADLDLGLDRLKQWSELQKEITMNTQLDTLYLAMQEPHLQTHAQFLALWDVSMKDLSTSLKPFIESGKEAENALKALGLEVKRAGTDTESLFTGMAKAIDSGNYSMLQIDDAWIKFGELAAKAGKLTQDVVDRMQAMGAPMQTVLNAQLKSLEAQMQMAEATDMTGKSELLLAEQIEKVKQKQESLHQATMGLADTYNAMIKSFDKAWTDLGKGIADAIVDGKNFGDVMMGVLKQLAKEILETLIGMAFKDLKKEILDNTNLLGGFNKLFNTVFGAGGELAKGFSDAAKASTDFAKGMAADMADVSGAVSRDIPMIQDSMKALGDSVGAATADASGALGTFAGDATASMATASTAVTAAGTSMLSTFSMIGTAIGAIAGAIAGIFSAIELMHTNTLLARIEESTRRADITLEGAVVTQLGFLTLLQDIANHTSVMMGDMHNMVAEMNAIPIAMTAMLAQMGAMVSGVSGESAMNPLLVQLLTQLNQIIAAGSGAGTTGYNPIGGIGSGRGGGPADQFGPIVTAAGHVQAAAINLDTVTTQNFAPAAVALNIAAVATTQAATAVATAAAPVADITAAATRTLDTASAATQDLAYRIAVLVGQGMTTLEAAMEILKTTGRGHATIEDAYRLLAQAGYTFADSSSTIIYQLSTGISNTLGALAGVTQATMSTVAAVQAAIEQHMGVSAAIMPTPTITPTLALPSMSVGPTSTPTAYSGPTWQQVNGGSFSPSSGLTLTVNVSAGVVAGLNGMQQLANMVGAQVVQSLRTTVGLKN